MLHPAQMSPQMKGDSGDHICLPTHLSISPSVCSSTHLSIHLPIYLSPTQFTCLSNSQFTFHPSIHACIYPCIHPSTHWKFKPRAQGSTWEEWTVSFGDPSYPCPTSLFELLPSCGWWGSSCRSSRLQGQHFTIENPAFTVNLSLCCRGDERHLYN